MSGGAFDYAQYRIADIYTEIEDEIYGHSLDDEFDVNRYIEDHWLEDSEKEYVRKHHHTIPNRSEYSKETIKEFKKGIALLKKAEVYAQRIDWLLSGDDGEDSLENYMPACRACNFRKRDMTLEQFRAEIKRQAVGLLSGAAKFQVKMSIAYGLIIPQFDKKVVFYFEKVKRKD